MIMSEYTVEVTCGSGNDYDGRMGVRISSIFVIGFGSMMGMSLRDGIYGPACCVKTLTN